MPFRYTWICDLLQAIEDIECRDPPYLPDRKRKALRLAVQDWVRKHRNTLDHPNTDATAILSILLPHTRTDRVYGIQAPRLQKLVARCLNLTLRKAEELGRWRDATQGDLGACLERLDKDHDCEPLPGTLTVEQIDAALRDIASRCRFSSPAIQKQISAEAPQQIMAPLLLRMHSREKKWFVRAVLKDYGRVVLDEFHFLTQFHFMLPHLLKFQNDFAAAITLLKGPLARYHASPDPKSQQIMLEDAAQHLKPKIGIKIGRPTWYKARSITNCLGMVGHGTWIIERKYDGEFCEIHVDLSKKDNIQIFSKNGKDATKDRENLLPAIRESLNIGTPECQFSSKCILLGEMVVFSHLESQIMDFDKIRKHVSRSGSFLGTDKDSQPHPYENLMICFFDVLLVDDEVTMTLPHAKRRQRLSEVTTKMYGLATRVEWMKLDFSAREATNSLINQFCHAISYRFEGLILKPNAPFFSLAKDETGSWCKGCIKLKKDYMADMGGGRDVADFAVVAASYDVHEAQKCKTQRNLQWTNFYLGCLVDGSSYDNRPRFRIVAVVKASHCIPPKDLEHLNQIGQFSCRNFDEDEQIEEFTIQLGRHPLPSVLFSNPFVVEVLGSSFEKPPNENFHMLRHPRILKTHMDRSWEDCITMQGLGDLAREAREAPAEGESQDIKDKVSHLLAKMKRARDRSSLTSRQTTPRSAGSTTSSSPLATLKTVTSAYALDTPSPASAPKHSRKSHHLASSSTPAKTPNPAMPLTEAKSTTSRSLFSVGFGKEVTPVSQQSTQWTDTIGTPAASARPHAQELLSTISPPQRIAVLDTSSVAELRLKKDPRPRARVEDPPCPDGQNTTSFRNPRLDNPGRTARRSAKTPADADSAKINPVDRVDTAELSFYEEREALSIKELRKQNLKSIASGCENVLRANAQTRASANASNNSASAPSSTATVCKESSAIISPRQKDDALDVATRARALRMTASQASTESEQEPAVQPRSNGGAPASSAPCMLPPIPMLNGLLTPPTSSPTEPPPKKKPSAPARLPRNPLVSPPNARPSAVTTTPNTKQSDENAHPKPITATKRLPTPNPLKRSLDDFDIDITPRKLPKWRSPVYGRPALPKPITSPTHTAANHTNESNTLTSSAPAPPRPSTLLPLLSHSLQTTTIYPAPSLHHHPLLLSPHLTTLCPHIITDLTPWSRDNTAYESMGSTVGESQAYAGYAKAVLVEPGKPAECAGVVRRVREAVGGERVGVFDWRVLGELVEGVGEDGDGDGDEGWERGVWGRWVWGVV